jgi:hypothetical protein
MPIDASGKPMFPERSAAANGGAPAALPRAEESTRALAAEAAIARQAEIQAQAKAALAKERAAGMRDGARHERERARAEQEAALNAVRAEHDAELLRRDALLERKLAEQRVEIRGAAFWRAAFTLGVPLALGSAVAGATFALGAAQTGMFGGLAAAERAALIAPREPQELTVSDPDFSLPDVAPEPAARRQGQEPANAP